MNKFIKFLILFLTLIIIIPPFLSYIILNYTDLNKRNLFKQKIIQASRVPYTNTRNVWQSNCTKYDEILLYFPKNGECEFNNLEYKTKINFNNGLRADNLDYNQNKPNILVLGDSVAMGWGVNDNETFSYILEDQISINVDNYAVSSYGTVRELQLLKRISKKYDLIILQYNINDYHENVSFYYNEIEYPRPKEIFNSLYAEPKSVLSLKVNYLLKLYNYFYIQPIKRRIFKKKNNDKSKKINYEDVMDNLFKSFILNTDIKSNIIIMPMSAHGKGISNSLDVYFKNMKKHKNFYYLDIDFDKNKHFFKLDDHPNDKGHKITAEKLIEFIARNKLLIF